MLIENDEKHALYVAMVLVHYKWYTAEIGGPHPPVDEHLAASELMCRVAFRLDQRWNASMNDTPKHTKQFFIEYWVKEHYKKHGYIYMRVPSSDE